MTRQTALKLALGYEALSDSVPSMIEGERLAGEFLSKVDDRDLLAILEPSFTSAHRRILSLASAMNRTAEILKSAIERGQ